MQISVLKIKLRRPNQGKAAQLSAMADAFTDCVRFHSERIEVLKTVNTTTIHRDCYQEARRRFRLPSSTIQQARDKAVATYLGFLARCQLDSRVRPPTFRRTLPLRLAAQNLRMFVDRSVVRISTSDGFLWLPLILPPCFLERLQLPHGATEIVRKGDDWYLMLAVKTPDVPTPGGMRPHFGLDLGLANVAVLAGPNTAMFFSGKPLQHVRSRFHSYRQALQLKRKIGMVKRSKGRESNWVTGENHRITRAIVDHVADIGGVLHIEKLTGIRERCKGGVKINRMMASWAFAQFSSFLRTKAAAACVLVIEEDPRYTSQRCSKCGHTERGNRTRQERFKCKSCGYESHADLNAARNLAAIGACSDGTGGVTSPWRFVAESGERMLAPKGLHRGNRNLISPL